MQDNDEPIVIKDPIKPWWPGDPRVEKYMPPVREAIMRHLPWPGDAYVDIYNRAYEAVYNAIKEYTTPADATKTPKKIRPRRKHR